jgi:hypothetical protein
MNCTPISATLSDMLENFMMSSAYYRRFLSSGSAFVSQDHWQPMEALLTAAEMLIHS